MSNYLKQQISIENVLKKKIGALNFCNLSVFVEIFTSKMRNESEKYKNYL